MLPAAVAGPVQGYVDEVRRSAPSQVEAVYAVGSLALGDFSARQSNVDLVLVADPALDPDQLGRLEQARRRMRHAGRAAQVWATTWDEVAGGPGADGARAGDGAPDLATPLTWAVLKREPLALLGPDWPVVWSDPDALHAWSLQRVGAVLAAGHGLLLWRRQVSPLVLEVARLAVIALTGRVVPKAQAGEALGPLVSSHFRRILTDSAGYREGAHFSMYWGPFERKYDALALLGEVAEKTAGG